MNSLTRSICLLLLLAAGFWGWRTFFPSDETAIRKLLHQTAAKASVRPDETGMSNYANARWIMNACTPDVRVTVEAPGLTGRTLQGRDKLGEALAAVRATSGSITVELIDIGIEVAPDRSTATAQFIAKASTDGSSDPIIQELRITLQRTDGDWKFHVIEPLSSLTL